MTFFPRIPTDLLKPLIFDPFYILFLSYGAPLLSIIYFTSHFCYVETLNMKVLHPFERE